MKEEGAKAERSDRVIARVLGKAEHLRGALIGTGLVSLFLVATVIDDWLNLDLVPLHPSHVTYSIVIATLIFGALVQWIVRPARAKNADVRANDGRISIDGKAIEDVRGMRVAKAAHGYSVAIAHGERVTFVEVEREEDAARIVGDVKGEVALPSRSRSFLTLVRMLLTLVTLVSVVAYYGGTEGWEAVWASKASGLFGVGAILLSFVLLGVQALRKRSVAGVMRGAWDAHVTLHESSSVDLGDSISHEGALARRDEPIDAWLSRVRAIPANEGAYRGDAMKRDVLWDKLADEHAPTDVRMAAARVLRIRYDEDAEKLRAAVSDRDVRVRIAAAIEDDDEEAAERIESLGPLFRAR